MSTSGSAEPASHGVLIHKPDCGTLEMDNHEQTRPHLGSCCCKTVHSGSGRPGAGLGSGCRALHHRPSSVLTGRRVRMCSVYYRDPVVSVWPRRSLLDGYMWRGRGSRKQKKPVRLRPVQLQPTAFARMRFARQRLQRCKNRSQVRPPLPVTVLPHQIASTSSTAQLNHGSKIAGRQKVSVAVYRKLGRVAPQHCVNQLFLESERREPTH